MRKAFAGLAMLLVLVVVTQFFFAAVGAFSTASHEESFRPHHVLGYVIFLLPVVMTIVAATARMPGRLIGLPALVSGLAASQVLIAEFAKAFNDTGGGTVAGSLIAGLHAVNGLAILGLSGTISRRVRTRSASTAEPGAAADQG